MAAMGEKSMSLKTATVVTVRIVLEYVDAEAEPGKLMFGQSIHELRLSEDCTIDQAVAALQAYRERHGV